MKKLSLIASVALLLCGCDAASHHKAMDAEHINLLIAACDKRGMDFRVETNIHDRVVEVYCAEKRP